MATMTGTNESLADLITAIGTGIFPGALATTTVHLYKNDVTPGLGTKLADLTEADFTGYASVAVTAWNNTTLDPATGLPIIVPNGPAGQTFTQSGVGITNTVYGMYIAFNGHVILAERFDNPVPMDAAGKQIITFPKVFSNVLYGPDSYED